MDKSWIDEQNRFSSIYISGVESFLQFSRENAIFFDNKILCPCNDCRNTKTKSFLEVKRDLHLKGFYMYYKEWIYHGESNVNRSCSFSTCNPTSDPTQNDNLNFENNEDNHIETIDELFEMIEEMRDAELLEQVSELNIENFERLLGDVRRELYPGCKKYSLLSFIVKLLHIKVQNKMTDKTINMIFELFKEVLPEDNLVPPSLYWARKLLSGIGLGYIKIEACKYDCALFWKENEQEEFCSICNELRWKYNDGKGKRIPHKILRRQFESSCRFTWKHFDLKNPNFAADPRNVRLGLATDGFNPFGNMRNSYSMWPVILIPYNMPLYKCMKDEFFMMPLLIPGPRAPGKDIDVYLRLLIDELKELWNGVETYDAYGKESFQMHAAIMWTINDFLALSNLLGWTTKGYVACPCCLYETDSKRIRSKICYMGHRRYLDDDHPFRKSKLFDGKIETRTKPREWTGVELLSHLNNLEHRFDKLGKHPSEFFRILCSKTLKVEHIEKMGRNIPLILCKLEKIFPPAFFDVMVHLAVHLPQEAKTADPVHSRWMYPIERYIERFLKSLKGYVHNKARPEGSIAEGYIVKECLTFMSMYLDGNETRFNKDKRNYDGAEDHQERDLVVFSLKVRPFGPLKRCVALSQKEIDTAQNFILNNCDEVDVYKSKHLEELKRTNDRGIEKRHQEQFCNWFRDHINLLHHKHPEEVSEDLWALANGPQAYLTKFYSGCIVNEVRFHIKDRDDHRTTQNSGLVVEGEHQNNMIEFYGFLTRLVELTYLHGHKVVLFECEWFNTGSKKTMQKDKYFVSIDIRSRWYKDEPFVLPNQVKQAFYVNDTKLGDNWRIVQLVHHRHLWDIAEQDDHEVEELNDIEQRVQVAFQQHESNGVSIVYENEDELGLAREDVEPDIVVEEFLDKIRKMPPKEAILHRPITRKSKSTNQEASHDDFFSSLVDIRSNIPSLPVSSPSPRPSSESSDLGDDSIGTGNESSHMLPSDNSTASASTKKRGRGASNGKSIEKAIADNVDYQHVIKEWLQLVRIQGPVAHLIGYRLRNDMLCVITLKVKSSRKSRKLMLRTGHVYRTIILQENESYVDNFAVTHKKNGVFVNEKAEASHVEMQRLRNQAKESGVSSISEREIVKQTLGKRSGYERGLGYGVVVENSSKRSAYETSQLESFKEKLSSTEEELRDAASRIKSQQEMIESQQAIIQGYDECCQK
ncbi:hypothetical protein BUALT_Bualt17G0008800 [Buddleja alternifolia]|uniref:Transposase n=1 Tax=Buddleja alternifolia TaxID=168488 RepID=A0AAV6W6M7_9LAMI|nr:hypothetical protein BUALT_Bualt17G0008800 [Buddleja alternifolia]